MIERSPKQVMKKLWLRKKKVTANPDESPSTASEPAEDRAKPEAGTAGANALPIVPFHLATCTLAATPSAAERAAFTHHAQLWRTRDAFWTHAPYADWMLDVLRCDFHYVAVVPERELRTFALACVEGLNGADNPGLAELLAAVRRRIEGNATLDELRALQERTRPRVSPGGVQGLPRCSSHAAGALAAWHSAGPNPCDAAFWTAEFAALHDAFVVLRDAAAGWVAPDDRGEPWRASWRVASFDTAHPHVRQEALFQARQRQATILRRILPQPFDGRAPALALHS